MRRCPNIKVLDKPPQSKKLEKPTGANIFSSDMFLIVDETSEAQPPSHHQGRAKSGDINARKYVYPDLEIRWKGT